jgi:hypothetical protein
MEIDYPTQEEFNNTVRRCVILEQYRQGDVRFHTMLRLLAEVEEEDGRLVELPFPISVKALIKGLKDEKE